MTRSHDCASGRSSRSISIAIVGGLLLASLGVACGAAADASTPPPIRVVRIGHGNVPAMKENITASVEACRVVKKLGAGNVPLPPDSVLAQLGVLETEELFNGAQWAEYEVQRSIAADAANGCKLVVFVHRSATVEQSCVWRVRGSNALLGALKDFESPAPSAPEIAEDKLSPQSCSSRKRAATQDTGGLPTEDAGAGASCIWNSALLARAMSKVAALADVAKSSAKDTAADTCLYEKRPHYEAAGMRRPVVLATKGELRSRTGVDVTTLFGEAAATTQRASAFSDGQPIAADRFTRAAVEAFMKLPAKAAVGAL